MTGRVSAGDLDTIAALEAHASGCRLCRLCRDRTQVVTGDGPERADVLVVAEAPGYHDDREGRLLDGPPGELFAEVLEIAGLDRTDIFLTSVVKCRPPSGRTPFPDEIEACEGWLFREIALVQPRVIVTLGALAVRIVTGRHERLADVHGQMLHMELHGRDMAVWPLHHPAAALHVPRIAAALKQDAAGLGMLVAGARAERSRRARAEAAPTPAHTPIEPVPAPAPVEADTGDLHLFDF